MVESVISSVTTTYTYNGAGIRVSRAVSGGATVDYTWDVAGALPVILDDGTYRYVYGLDLIAAIESNDTEHYFLYDGLGSVTEVTDDAGDVEASFRYDVFGAVRVSSGSTDLEFRFTGEQEDPSGLYFLRARYYDPGTGRFISRDLVEFDQRYAYVGGNPLLYVDANGLCRNPASDEKRSNNWLLDKVERAKDSLDCVADAAVGTASWAIDGSTEAYLRAAESFGYVDANVTACWSACFTGGVQVHLSQGVAVYGGGGAGSPQAGLALTHAPGQRITPGLNCGAQLDVGAGLSAVGQVGIAGKEADAFAEYGFGVGLVPLAAGAVTCYQVRTIPGWW